MGAAIDRPAIRILGTGLVLYESCCKAYLICWGREALLVDVGDGGIFDRLAELGIERVTDVLMTHHHRDQAQGLGRAVAAGARVWVPETERDLFSAVVEHRRGRPTMNSYNVRQDRFSLLEPVSVGGLLRDYETLTFGGLAITVLPTPGHTPGSVSLLAEIDGVRTAFTGDLIAGPGKVWSLAATQWTYNGAEGVAAMILSLADLKERHPQRLLPSHGEIQSEPEEAIDRLISRLQALLVCRGEYAWLDERRLHPYREITPHLLVNGSSVSDSYVLLSESGGALFIDFGYDFSTGLPAGEDRASRRPWLYSLAALKRQYGVAKIEVAIPTHPHDDHVAGMNLLRRVEGAEIWAAEIAAPVLTDPARYDLPCLWYDPIPVDRIIPFGCPVRWHEYELTLYPLPGHSQYAAAIGFEVDGKRVLATGDQYQSGDGTLLNYVYPNRFNSGDFRASAALFRRLAPDMLLTGHWGAQPLTEEYLCLLETRGEEIARLHDDLLPEEIRGWGTGGFGARLEPYRASAAPGDCIEYSVEIANPLNMPAAAVVRPAAPDGWVVLPREITCELGPAERKIVNFTLAIPTGAEPGLVCFGVDLAIDGRPFGQQAEAMVTVVQSIGG
jgi:glyoxylase-like metal-dependent hydrolase (beta-lactamase superfamily II)